MQIINILCNDGRDFAHTVEGSQRAMAAPRFCRSKRRLHGETPPPGLVAGLCTDNEFIERDRSMPTPQAPGRTKIRNAALRRDSRSRKWNDHRCRSDHLTELVNSIANV